MKKWRGTTLEQRRDERRTALLEAAIEIVGSAGAAALTTRSVADRANLRERHIYEVFSSRDDLLLAAFDAVLERELAASVQGAFEGSEDVIDAVRRMCRTALARAERDPGYVRILLVEPASDPVLRQRSGDVQKFLVQLTLERMLLPSLASRFDEAELKAIATMIVGGAIALLTAWNERTISSSADQVIDLLVFQIQRWIDPEIQLFE